MLGAAPSPSRSLMARMFAPLGRLIEASLDQRVFDDPRRRARLDDDAQVLAAAASEFQALPSLSSGDVMAAQALAIDAVAAAESIRRGDLAEARAAVQQLTDHCVACHATTAEGPAFSGAGEFLKVIAEADLPAPARAHLLVMSRAYDEALATYEQLFRSREVPPGVSLSLASFIDYLRVCIAAKGDFHRPRTLLEALRDRPATQSHERRQIVAWIDEIKRYERGAALADNTLATPRRIIEETAAAMRGRRDSAGLVRYVVAETLLNRYVAANRNASPDLAEAYLLLGIASDLLDASETARRSEAHLETAVRTAPSSAAAARAYSILEDRVSEEFGEEPPPPVAQRLRELRALIDARRQRGV